MFLGLTLSADRLIERLERDSLDVERRGVIFLDLPRCIDAWHHRDTLVDVEAEGHLCRMRACAARGFVCEPLSLLVEPMGAH